MRKLPPFFKLNQMKEKIKQDIEYISKDKNNVCNNPDYLRLLNHLHDNFSELSRGAWLITAQHHNATRYVKSFPHLSGKIDKSLNQLIRLAGGYIIEVHGDKFSWNDCVYDDASDVANCIWDKES